MTAYNQSELKDYILDFMRGDDIKFRSFLDRKVMEKYIGPLDGLNFERNLSFIYEMIEHLDDVKAFKANNSI